MPRYEFSEGTSNKFWQIELDGASFTTTYGRIGTSGQTSLKELDSEEKAKKEYDKLVAEKVKKGYVLVDDVGSAPAAPQPAASAPASVPANAPAKKSAALFDDEGDDDDDAPSPKPAAAKPASAKPAADSGASKSGDPNARYFELVEGTSSKFWEIQLDGASFTTRYGKIGTAGQQTLKEYASGALARKEYEKLVAEKTRKGYVEK